MKKCLVSVKRDDDFNAPPPSPKKYQHGSNLVPFMYYKRATYDNLSWEVVLKVCNIFAHNQRAGACLRDAAAEFEFLPRWKIFATQPSGVWISDVGWHLPPPFHVPMWKKIKQLSHWFGIDNFIHFLFHLCPNQVCLRIHCFVCTIYNYTWLPQAVPSSSARPKRVPVCSGSLDLVRAAVQLGGQFGRRSSLFPPGTQRERERELLELTTWRPSVVTLPTVLQLSLQFDQDIISWY